MNPGPAVDADPVLALFAEAGEDPRGLYYLWEQQQWEAGKVDLALDAEQWSAIDPATRRLVADSVAWRRLRAEVATTALVPFVDLAPTEEQQVFLTTQLVDEARHLVFFDRVHAEVAGRAEDRIEERGGIVDDAHLRVLLTEILPRVAADLRAPDAGLVELAAAVVGFHLVILGAFGLTEQRALTRYLTELDVLPGIRCGLELEGRAAHRHVAFGLGLVAMLVGRHPEVRVAAEEAFRSSMPEALAALSSIAERAPAPYLGAGLEDVARAALRRWSDGAGLNLAVRS